MTKAKSATATVSAPIYPRDIVVIGTMLNAFQQACVHIRQGYRFSPDVPMTVFAANGTVSIPLVIGTPDQFFIDAAAVTAAEAAAREEVQYQRDVEQAAERLIEAKALAEKEAKKAAMLADQKAQLAALEASFTTQ